MYVHAFNSLVAIYIDFTCMHAKLGKNTFQAEFSARLLGGSGDFVT